MAWYWQTNTENFMLRASSELNKNRLRGKQGTNTPFRGGTQARLLKQLGTTLQAWAFALTAEVCYLDE